MKRLAPWLAILSATGCTTGPEVSERVRTWTGPMAVACGTVAPGADPSAADSCALSAWERGVPFWVRYAGCGCDSTSETVFLRAADGRLLTIRTEPEPDTRSSRFGPRLRLAESECSPLVLQVAPGQRRLTCVDERVAARPGTGLDLARCALERAR
ncbi:MAG: hypothetical protein U0529_10830 [Thermoanaerobaculia bacterium]